MQPNQEQKELLHPDLSYKIVGCCYKVHNEIGRFSKEKQYSDRLAGVFEEQAIHFQRENRVEDTNDFVDFLVEDSVVVEIKAKDTIQRLDYYQVQRYLQATNKQLGLLVNFRQQHLKPKRVVKIEGTYS